MIYVVINRILPSQTLKKLCALQVYSGHRLGLRARILLRGQVQALYAGHNKQYVWFQPHDLHPRVPQPASSLANASEVGIMQVQSSSDLIHMYIFIPTCWLQIINKVAMCE